MRETSQSLEIILFMSTMDAKLVQPAQYSWLTSCLVCGKLVMQGRPGQLWCLLPFFCWVYISSRCRCTSQIEIFCPMEHISIWYIDGKGPRVSVKTALTICDLKRYIWNNSNTSKSKIMVFKKKEKKKSNHEWPAVENYKAHVPG